MVLLTVAAWGEGSDSKPTVDAARIRLHSSVAYNELFIDVPKSDRLRKNKLYQLSVPLTPGGAVDTQALAFQQLQLYLQGEIDQRFLKVSYLVQDEYKRSEPYLRHGRYASNHDNRRVIAKSMLREIFVEPRYDFESQWALNGPIGRQVLGAILPGLPAQFNTLDRAGVFREWLQTKTEFSDPQGLLENLKMPLDIAGRLSLLLQFSHLWKQRYPLGYQRSHPILAGLFSKGLNELATAIERIDAKGVTRFSRMRAALDQDRIRDMKNVLLASLYLELAAEAEGHSASSEVFTAGSLQLLSQHARETRLPTLVRAVRQDRMAAGAAVILAVIGVADASAIHLTLSGLLGSAVGFSAREIDRDQKLLSHLRETLLSSGNLLQCGILFGI